MAIYTSKQLYYKILGLLAFKKGEQTIEKRK